VEKRKNNLILIVALALLMISVVFVIVALNIDSLISLNKMVIPAKVTIGDHSGIDANTDVLSFGNITYDSFGHRNISIGNNYDFPVVFEFDVKGNISEVLIYYKSVYLNVGEEKNITFSTIVAPESMKGDYSGTVIVKVKKAS